MDNNIIEIRDEEINVEEIMEKIRERIRIRQEAGVMPGIIHDNPSYFNANWDIHNYNYTIASHRPFIGKILVKGRELVHNEVRRYIDPVVNKQIEFNQTVGEVLEDSIKNDYEIKDRLCRVEDFLQQLESKDIKETNWENYYDYEIQRTDLEENINHHKEFITLIIKYARKSAQEKIPRLMEVGIGTATMSIYFSELSFEVIGIDNDISIIHKAIKTNEKLGGYAKFILMDIFDLKIIKSGYFDVTFSQGTMEHFNNEMIYETIEKQLGVSSFVIFSVPSKYYPKREFGNERKMTLEDWNFILKGGGFNVIESSYYQEKMHIYCVIGQT